MKVLHTADLHLGVKTMGRDRLETQKRTMKEICMVADREQVDIVILAGDIYNNSVPTANAEELFYDFIENISNGGNRLVLVVSGNHDDPERLCAGLPLAYKHNIVLAGNLDKLDDEKFIKNKEIEIVKTGTGFLKVRKGNEIVNISYLPFDSTVKAKQESENLSYSALVGKMAKEVSQEFQKDEFNIFVSHLFLVGSKLSHDRMVSVGDVFAVSLQDLPEADYIALGHIHNSQQIGTNAFYSGSTSRLRPSQKPLSVNVFETNKEDIKFKQVVLNSPEQYKQIKVGSLLEAEKVLSNFKERDLIEITFVLSEPLKASEIKTLKKDFPCISMVNLELVGEDDLSVNSPKISRKNLSDKELFQAFYKRKKGVEPRDSLLELFLTCKGGKNEAD